MTTKAISRIPSEWWERESASEKKNAFLIHQGEQKKNWNVIYIFVGIELSPKQATERVYVFRLVKHVHDNNVSTNEEECGINEAHKHQIHTYSRRHKGRCWHYRYWFLRYCVSLTTMGSSQPSKNADCCLDGKWEKRRKVKRIKVKQRKRYVIIDRALLVVVVAVFFFSLSHCVTFIGNNLKYDTINNKRWQHTFFFLLLLLLIPVVDCISHVLNKLENATIQRNTTTKTHRCGVITKNITHKKKLNTINFDSPFQCLFSGTIIFERNILYSIQ